MALRRGSQQGDYGAAPEVLHRQQFALDTRMAQRWDTIKWTQLQSDRINGLPIDGQAGPVVPTKSQPVSRPPLVGYSVAPTFHPRSSLLPGQDIWQYVGPAHIATQASLGRMSPPRIVRWLYDIKPPTASSLPIVPVGR